jgi:hypothetical protein
MSDVRKPAESAPECPVAAPGLTRTVDPRALSRLLASWMAEEPGDQRQTFEALRIGLDEARGSGRKLFPNQQ